MKKFILFFLKLTPTQYGIEWDDSIGYFAIFNENSLYKKAIRSIFSDTVFLDENMNNNSLFFICKSIYFYWDLEKEAQQKIIEKALEIESTITNKLYLLPFVENEEIIKILLRVINGSNSDFFFSTEYLNIYNSISSRISENDKIAIFENFKKIFERLKSNYEKKKASPFHNDNISYSFQILYALVAIEKNLLNGNGAFDNFFEDVKNYYFSNFMQLDNWMDIVLNSDEDDFKSFACTFFDLFKYLDKKNACAILRTIFERFIFQDSGKYDAIINHIFLALHDKELREYFFNEPLLNTLLYKFQTNISNIHDRIFIEHRMVYIALILKENGIDNEQVKYWLEYGGKSEFKEVRDVLLIN